MAEQQGQAENPREGLQRVSAFDAKRLTWSLWRDMAARRAVGVAVVALIFMSLMLDTGATTLSILVTVVIVGAWVAMSVISARVMRELKALTPMIDADPGHAEHLLVPLLKRWPLVGWVRLMLMHRLAAVRHHQQRFGECAAICRALLPRHLGPAEASRPHLLLLLTESSLAIGDLAGAYQALASLYTLPVSLTEALQRLALQTRYEAMIGADDAALASWDGRVAMAELMPAPQGGALHAMLAVCAERTGREEEAAWLWRRAELLCRPEQLESLRKGVSGVGVVGGVPDHMAGV